MSAAYDSILKSCSIINAKMDKQNEIIVAQREELAATRLALGHAQDCVESLLHELAALKKDCQDSWVLLQEFRAYQGE